MFKLKMLIGIVVGLVMVTGNVWGQNLLSNPSFELGTVGKIPDDWFSANNEGYFVIDNIVAHTGVNSIKADFTPIQGLTLHRYIYRNKIEEIPIWATYKLSIWAKGNSGGENLNVSIRGYQLLSCTKNFILTTVWQEYSYEFIRTVPGDLNFGAAYNTLPYPIIWVDDISLTIVRTVAENRIYYQNILNDINATKSLKDEANNFFAALYQYLDKDFLKAIPYLETLNTKESYERVGDYQLQLTDFLKAIEAYKKAVALATVNNQPDAVKSISQKLEGAITTAKQLGLMPK